MSHVSIPAIKVKIHTTGKILQLRAALIRESYYFVSMRKSFFNLTV